MIECPNCHYMNKEGTKFCIKCGSALTTDTPTTNANPNNNNNTQAQQIDVSKATNNFFAYFLGTLKNPINEIPGNDKYLGIVSLVIYTVLSFLGIYTVLNTFFRSLGVSAVPEPFSQTANGYGLVMALSSLLVWIVGYACLKIMKNNESLPTYNNHVGKFYNVGSVLLLVGLLLGFLLPSSLSIPLLVIIVGYFTGVLGTLYVVFQGENHAKIDKFYVVLIAVTIVIIIHLILFSSLVIQPLQNNMQNIEKIIGGILLNNTGL